MFIPYEQNGLNVCDFFYLIWEPLLKDTYAESRNIWTIQDIQKYNEIKKAAHKGIADFINLVKLKA